MKKKKSTKNKIICVSGEMSTQAGFCFLNVKLRDDNTTSNKSQSTFSAVKWPQSDWYIDHMVNTDALININNWSSILLL